MTDRQRDRLRAATLAAYDMELTGREPRRTRGTRRGLALALAVAAIVGLAGVVAAAESEPGQPLYGLRLTIESLALPAGGAARTEALLVQLDRRLDEVRGENERGHGAGVVDAVGGYLATLDALQGGIDGGASDGKVEEALNRHVDAFRHVLPSTPANAYGEVQHAIRLTEQAHRAVESGRGGPSRTAEPSPSAVPSPLAQPPASAEPSPSAQPPASGQPAWPTSPPGSAPPNASGQPGQPGQPSAPPGRP